MAKKITQYPASAGNPDVGSLIDISELNGSIYTTKKLTIQQLLDYLTANLVVGGGIEMRNNTGTTILKGTPVEINSYFNSTTANLKRITSSASQNKGKIYIAEADILNSAVGNCIESGIIQFPSAFTTGENIFWNTTTNTFTNVDTLDDNIFIGVILLGSLLSTGRMIVSPHYSKQLVKGLPNQIPLFTSARVVGGNSHFTYIDSVGTEVGFTFDDGSNNITKVGVTYINVESEGIASNSVLRLANWASNSNKGIISFRKSRGSKASPTKVLNQDVLGTTIFAGSADKSVDGIFNSVSGMTTGEIVIRALQNFSKDYNIFLDETNAQGLTQFEIWLQSSAGYTLGDLTPPNIKVFSVDGDGKVYFKNYQFPLNSGTNGQVLSVVSAGQLGWVTPTSPTVSIPATRIPYGNAGNLLTTDSDFVYFEDSNTASLYDRSAIQLSSTQIDHNGLVKFGAVQWIMESTASFWGQLRKNNTTNLGSGGVIRIGSLDQSIGSGNYALVNQLWGEIQFGFDGFRVGASIKSFTEQAVTNMLGSGSRLEFHVTPNNTNSPLLAMKIDNTGKTHLKNYSFPLADGTPNQFLKTDGAGQLSFANGGFANSNQGFSPMAISVCDTAPTANSTQYYYQTVSEITGSINRMKIWGYSGVDTCFVGVYRGTLSGSKTLIGVGSASCGIGPNDIVLTAKVGQTLDLVAGENLIVGFYPNGTSFRSIYDVGIADLNFAIENTANLTTELPATPTGTGTAIRFACTLYNV